MDPSNPSAMIRALLPKTPFVLKTALLHSLRLSSTSSKWDLKTELIVRLIRDFISSSKPNPVSKQQAGSLKDPGIKGRMWISKVTLERPEEDDVRQELVKAIDALRTGNEKYTVPEITPVEAEWTGYRAEVDAKSPRPDLSEEQHYEELMKEVTSDVTFLYFHGGAFYLMDPSSHRPSTAKLAQLTSGRVLSVRYRLAPQSTFPAALLDALISYLSLLSPPPNSPHGPISASHIVLAGDSAGGNLAMSLLQLLLQLHRSSPTDPSSPPTIRFHGKDVPIPLPAGVATTSAWLDMTRSMPSLVTNYHYDYLTPASVGDAAAHFPPCAVWPTDPPRGDLYSDDSMLCHPLVSPLAAKDWSGSCPLWMGYGQEMLVDEGKIAARRASRQGVPVVWEEWEAMPHTFALIFGGSEFGKEYFRHWAAFAKRVVGEGRKGGTEAVVTSGKWVEAKTLKEKEVDVGGLLPELTDEEVDRLMGEGMVKRSKGIEGEAKVLPKL